MYPLVSVVIPIHNGVEFLEEAITSILQSDYPNFEIILVDDGSTDSSLLLCNNLAQKHREISVFSFEKNRGMSHALNYGIQQAKGTYIARINQDDLMQLHRLSMQVSYLETHKDHVAVGGAIEFFTDRDKPFATVTFPKTDEEIKQHWLYLSPFADPAVMYRKSVFAKTAGYQQEFWPVDDVQMWYQLGALGKLANLSDVVTKVRWHKNAGSVKRHRLQVQRLFQLHMWTKANVATKPTLFVWGFWYAQLAAGYLFPSSFNWYLFRHLRRIRS